MTPSANTIAWGAQALERELAADLPGLQVQVQASVDSTNTRLLELCRAFDGARFDPQGFYAWCEAQVSGASMDRKWFPDFVRIVDDFEYTKTQKVLVRGMKKVHFDRRRLRTDPIYWRRRGDTSYHPFAEADFDALRKEFAAAEKLDLLDR